MREESDPPPRPAGRAVVFAYCGIFPRPLSLLTLAHTSPQFPFSTNSSKKAQFAARGVRRRSEGDSSPTLEECVGLRYWRCGKGGQSVAARQNTAPAPSRRCGRRAVLPAPDFNKARAERRRLTLRSAADRPPSLPPPPPPVTIVSPVFNPPPTLLTAGPLWWVASSAAGSTAVLPRGGASGRQLAVGGVTAQGRELRGRSSHERPLQV